MISNFLEQNKNNLCFWNRGGILLTSLSLHWGFELDPGLFRLPSLNDEVLVYRLYDDRLDILEVEEVLLL